MPAPQSTANYYREEGSRCRKGKKGKGELRSFQNSFLPFPLCPDSVPTISQKLKLEEERTSDHEDVAALFSFLNMLAPDVFTGLERVFLSVGLTAPLLSDAHEDELGGILEALRNGRYCQKSLDEALLQRFQRKMNEFIETEERRKGMRNAGVGDD